MFTAGGGPHYNWNPFHGNQDDLPLRIYEQVFQPSAKAISVGWGAAFVLMTLVLTLFVLARLHRIGPFRPVRSICWFSLLHRNRSVSEP